MFRIKAHTSGILFGACDVFSRCTSAPCGILLFSLPPLHRPLPRPSAARGHAFGIHFLVIYCCSVALLLFVERISIHTNTHTCTIYVIILPVVFFIKYLAKLVVRECERASESTFCFLFVGAEDFWWNVVGSSVADQHRHHYVIVDVSNLYIQNCPWAASNRQIGVCACVTLRPYVWTRSSRALWALCV